MFEPDGDEAARIAMVVVQMNLTGMLHEDVSVVVASQGLSVLLY